MLKLGIVNKIIDGDTFTTSSGETIRLARVNAAEKGGPLGLLAKIQLESLLSGQIILFQIVARDVFGRIVAEVYSKGVSVNNEMIKQGWK